MAVEHHVKRIIYVAECRCDTNEPWRKIWTDSPPHQAQCQKCGMWHNPIEETASSQEYRGQRLLNENG